MKPKWQKPLTKAEIKHLHSVAGCRSLKAFSETVRHQKQAFEDATSKDIPVGIRMPCWECHNIARKLGLWS